ncbi:[FeFe] hydrogenase H-cluster radical SAM maturase HydE [Clostridium botulinum]|uniref:[FeFe] hydrogenase H-cluster radical SAM maturase HydE n=1 Tax=Clostridium botulinum TaxID=1491 RepID=A0AA43YAB6_CLOBO|nr:[FeFe] hydrogenase H-cluster radical SAM maturase HydE [Clostridium botulinum]APH18654.1 [FeFe] hydrogenase H-cluster radical SAM maturase HydE [Clostridium botulinum]AUM93110.1 [FeFe] hydrogenase H-cluster radical SAM maturase HydE [Clostridium botulinum]KEI73779.1 biotin synthase [Clostridium botulinum A2 117]MBN3417629.1 [FeFe] hydrogenase H-cluster radical SAM maturase HydE [Clostridium botulinum]MBN3444041.1 [FeFe] hydrogenase H-cluster radical SAM maturase HydE [Clostridium botulinum]
MKKIIDELYERNNTSNDKLLYLLNNIDKENKKYLIYKAHETSLKYYDNKVYLRGLIEFTNYCKNACLYCGISCNNNNAERYRLSEEEILNCCKKGYSLGYRTFVLQGGEDPYYTDNKIIDIIKSIKKLFPDCAITLSIGEKSYETYKKFYEAGADRYLLRHETASKNLYEKLHPDMSFENRRLCLKNLKKIGYQVGAGFMIGLPNQTNEDYVNDLIFLKELKPHMVGIGPFIPHKDTILKNQSAGTLEDTTTLLALIRLLLPEVLLPATTALGTINPMGREAGLKAGANVVMPNLSPTNVRNKYMLYDNKICTGDEAAECRKCIENRINNAGFSLDLTRGDNILWRRI